LKTCKPFAEEGNMAASCSPRAFSFAESLHTNIKNAFVQLEGLGKGRQHIKLASIEDIQTKKLAPYIPLALLAAQTGA
jgi:hypothetical protein